MPVDFVIGHLYSALSAGQVPADRRDRFEAGLRDALQPWGASGLAEDVPVDVLVGVR